MNLRDKIKDDMKSALKAHDKTTLSTTRLLLSEVKNAEIARQAELGDEDVIGVVSSELRKRNEAITEYGKAGRDDLVAKEKAEAGVLRRYLPPALSDEELAAVIDETIAESGASGVRDMGKVMKQIMPKVKGRADGAKVSETVKARLASGSQG